MQRKRKNVIIKEENDYYIFYATNKVSGRREIIQCGMGAAKDFLRLIGHEGLSLFNPLHGEGGVGGHGGVNIGGNGGRRKKKCRRFKEIIQKMPRENIGFGKQK